MTILLLDVMDTIVRDPFWTMPEFFGCSFEEIWKDKDPTSWIEFEHGDIDEATFVSRFWADGRPLDHAAFISLFRDGYAWIEGMESLLSDLKEAGVAMHALSNYPRWFEMIEARLELSRFLEWTFVSCLTGVRKPDPEAYRGPARTLGVDPSQCLFVDDRGSNCKAAAAVGMGAIKFVGAEALRIELRNRGIAPV
ncbi:MAG: HAD-IA family hydrolase [Proteobacteria bacterium]|nr:HAD-IA family hydrolase [Pseudomonadota bacterium]